MAALLEQVFGRRLGQELLRLAENGELRRSDEFARRCRRAIWLRALARRPLATLSGLLGYYVPEARLWTRPAGLSVAVLGPDGSGKSAVCSALASASRAILPFSTVDIQHLYERALPRLSELKHGRIRRTPVAPATVHDPHGKRPHKPIVSLVTLGYAMLDQWVSRLWLGRRRLARNGLLCHDRYMTEIVVDPRRFRFGGPTWFARAFARLTPPLDLIILLDAPAEVLQSRKQEVPYEETRRQRDAYRDLVRRMPNGHVVSADQPVDQVIDNVKRIILTRLADRTARRFGLGRGLTNDAEAAAPAPALGLYEKACPR